MNGFLSLLCRKLVVVYYGLGWVQIFEFILGCVLVLGWVCQMMVRVTENGPTDNCDKTKFL